MIIALMKHNGQVPEGRISFFRNGPTSPAFFRARRVEGDQLRRLILNRPGLAESIDIRYIPGKSL